jgi:hypothetical protein
LDSQEAIAEYLSQVLEDGDNDEFIRAIGHIAKAKGMGEILRGEIRWAESNPTVGREQRGLRPVLILSDNTVIILHPR